MTDHWQPNNWQDKELVWQDEELVEFVVDADLVGLSRDDARALIELHGDAYRHDVHVAMVLCRWAERAEEIASEELAPGLQRRDGSSSLDDMASHWRDVAAHFMRGHFSPGGAAFTETADWMPRGGAAVVLKKQASPKS